MSNPSLKDELSTLSPSSRMENEAAKPLEFLTLFQKSAEEVETGIFSPTSSLQPAPAG